MLKFTGKSVHKGIVIGPVFVPEKEDFQVKRRPVEDAGSERKRIEKAAELSKVQLQELYEKAAKEAGEAGAAIFQVHQMLLEDETYLDEIYHKIDKEMINAEYAVTAVGNRFSEMLAGMEDDYMKARAADIKDISHRLVRNLSGKTASGLCASKPSIVVTKEISPGEIMQMDRKNILALVTLHGSQNSHTAILARMMNIPALTGVPVDFQGIHTGMNAVVDGFQGEVIFEPTAQICEEVFLKIAEEKEKQQLLQTLKGKENVTPDGRKINIFANISSIEELGDALEQDAEGIGLFRSECLYLGRNDFPTEEEQFQVYRQTLQAMNGKKVIIRTLDIGADKQADYFNLEKEANPAMGCRAIRICLKQPKIFKTQLRALLRAAVFGNLSIMYPMIISPEEVTKIYEIVAEAKDELAKAKIPYKIPEQGIMIETPAAVMVSDELAKLVDFFSIGTNDLTQYTLAIDRQNEKLDDFYNPHHRAILKMIRMVTENAHKNGKRVGICGELAADPELTEEFVCIGVDELSVTPSMILKLRKIIREMQINTD